MLKRRVIPVLLLRDGRMVKGRQFREFRDTGNPATAIRIYSAQDADELVFLDIQGGGRTELLRVLREASKECFMPLAAGGGVTSVDEVRELVAAGADKVVITTQSVVRPQLITEVARQFGAQCVVAGIDFRREESGPKVWIRSGSERTELDPVEHARRLVQLGAGEIFLNSIDRDGMMEGYDLDMAAKLADAVTVPVILCGGAGHFMHLAEALQKTGVSAVACASLFHFGDNNPIRARSYLRNQKIEMRRLK